MITGGFEQGACPGVEEVASSTSSVWTVGTASAGGDWAASLWTWERGSWKHEEEKEEEGAAWKVSGCEGGGFPLAAFWRP